MKNENNLLTEKEIYYLCISSIIGIGFFKLAQDIVRLVGQDGWIPNILGAIYPAYIVWTSSYIIKKFPNDNIFDISKKYFGKFFGTILGFMYMLQFLMLIPSVTAGFTNILRVYAVTFLPKININISILLIAWYCAMSGIKNIARMSKLIIFIFLFPITISIGALKTGNILNLQPVFQLNFRQLVEGALLTSFQYSGMEFLLLVNPYIKNKNTVRKTTFKALGALVIIYTWIVFITIFYLGPELVQKSSWPFTLVTESIVVPVINNFRFVFISLWTIVIIKTISNYYYYATEGISSNFNLEYKNVAAILFPIFIIMAMLYKNEIIRRYIGNIIINSTIVFNAIYVTVICIMTYFRERKKQNKTYSKQLQDKRI